MKTFLKALPQKFIPSKYTRCTVYSLGGLVCIVHLSGFKSFLVTVFVCTEITSVYKLVIALKAIATYKETTLCDMSTVLLFHVEATCLFVHTAVM